MRVVALSVIAAVSAHFTGVEYVHYEDARCSKPVATVTRPVGQCIKEMREGHYRLLTCSSQGLVTDAEYSDPACKHRVLSLDIPTRACHEGGGHSIQLTCNDATSFTKIKPTWADPAPVVYTNVTNGRKLLGSCPGLCQPNDLPCGSGYKAGMCPGADNVQCCPMTTPSCDGQCQQNSLPCAGNYQAGLCPGGNDIQCCSTSGGGGGCLDRGTVINRLVAKANGQYCECVCPHLSPWRCDCSGLVSYAWELAAPGQVTSTLPKYSGRLAAWTDMKPGDIILKPAQHVEMFHAWESGTSVFGYCGCHNTADGCSCRTGSTASYWQANGYYPAKGNMVC